MNNLYKVLVWASLAIASAGLFLPAVRDAALGGVTNFDSLELRSAVAGDNALLVRNSSGSAILTISGAGASTFASGTTFSSSLTASGESRVNRIRDIGSVLRPATSSVVSLTAAQFCDNGLILFQDWVGVASSTAILNLPAAESVFSDCLTTNGDTFNIVIRNEAAASASTTAIIAASASTTLIGVDANSDIINGGNWALLKAVRASSTMMMVTVEELTDAD